ncbi:TIGR00645 family protein [Telmatospirillum siberiense]|uniref:TIGR00645 family protein n=1 Tax=Telmatospirillum siberiense TaxID=382514 RepID=UPI0018EA48D7
MERLLERFLFGSRWIQAPLYVGLTLLLVAFVIKFFQEILHSGGHILEMREQDLVLMALSLIDLVLVANLLVMVIISGYENFVSRIETDDDTETLAWVGKLDSGTLKLKVAASIVAISSINLLKAFMNAEDTPNDKLLWLVVMHLTFVVSALLMGLLDKLAFAGHRDH